MKKRSELTSAQKGILGAIVLVIVLGLVGVFLFNVLIEKPLLSPEKILAGQTEDIRLDLGESKNLSISGKNYTLKYTDSDFNNNWDSSDENAIFVLWDEEEVETVYFNQGDDLEFEENLPFKIFVKSVVHNTYTDRVTLEITSGVFIEPGSSEKFEVEKSSEEALFFGDEIKYWVSLPSSGDELRFVEWSESGGKITSSKEFPKFEKGCLSVREEGWPMAVYLTEVNDESIELEVYNNDYEIEEYCEDDRNCFDEKCLAGFCVGSSNVDESKFHDMDKNRDYNIELSELSRIIQFHNSEGYHCQTGTEEGYAPGVNDGKQECGTHDADLNGDWKINGTELNRVIEFFDEGYYPSEETKDGFEIGEGNDCGTNDECSGGGVCLNGVCVQGVNFDCSSDDVCGDNEVCQNGHCILLSCPYTFGSEYHKADLNGDWKIDVGELLRIIQFHNSEGYHCNPASEDGYAPGVDDDRHMCGTHDADLDGDWKIDGEELNRIREFNKNGFKYCPEEDTTDGYCIRGGGEEGEGEGEPPSPGGGPSGGGPSGEEDDCGDGIVDEDEECDGDNLSGKSCLDWGYDKGTLSCDEDCNFDRRGCGYEGSEGEGEGEEGEGEGEGEGEEQSYWWILYVVFGILIIAIIAVIVFIIFFSKKGKEGFGKGKLSKDKQDLGKNKSNQNVSSKSLKDLPKNSEKKSSKKIVKKSRDKDYKNIGPKMKDNLD